MPVEIGLVQPAQLMLWDLRESAGALVDRLGEFLPHADLAWLREPAEDPVFLAAFWNDQSPDVWLVGSDYDDFWQLARTYAASTAGAFDFSPLVELLQRLLVGWELPLGHDAGHSDAEHGGVRYQNVGPVDGYPQGWWQGYDSVEQVWKYLQPGTVPSGGQPDDRTPGWLRSSHAFPPTQPAAPTRANTTSATTTRQQRAETVYAIALETSPTPSYNKQQQIWNDIWKAVGETEPSGWNQQYSQNIADHIRNGNLTPVRSTEDKLAGQRSEIIATAQLKSSRSVASFSLSPALSKAYPIIPIPEGMQPQHLSPDERQAHFASSLELKQTILTAAPKQTFIPNFLTADPVLDEGVKDVTVLPGGSVAAQSLSVATEPVASSAPVPAGEFTAGFIFRLSDPARLRELPLLEPADRTKSERDERILRLDLGATLGVANNITLRKGEVIQNRTFIGAYIDLRGANTLVVPHCRSIVALRSGRFHTIANSYIGGLVINSSYQADHRHVLHIDFGETDIVVFDNADAEDGSIINCVIIGVYIAMD